jgi:sulfur relay (sulfurtransferase) DsrF/TusC family protein
MRGMMGVQESRPTERNESPAMEKDILVLIKSDPEQSHRPVEAIRIALGLLSSQHRVKLILLGKAPLLLGDEAEDLVDGEELEKYLPPFNDLDQTFYVEKEAFQKAGLAGCNYQIIPVSTQEISKFIAQADRHLIF